MDERKTRAIELVDRVELPATKEELINALLVENAPANVVDLFERLPKERYGDRETLLADLEELARVHREEIKDARTYNDFLALVLLHTGDIQHTSKETFNHVVDEVMGIAHNQGTLDDAAAEQMRHRLYAAWVDLRRPMEEVYDEDAPIDPSKDLPNFRE